MNTVEDSKPSPTPRMAPPLQEILDAELRRGNVVVEVADWPPTCHLLVILKRSFHKTYDVQEDVTYRDVEDRHYWKAEYSYKNGFQCLACGFEQVVLDTNGLQVRGRAA